MMAFKLTPDQLQKFLSNPTPANLKAIVDGDPETRAKVDPNNLLGTDGKLKASRKHHMTDALDTEKLRLLAQSRITEDDLVGAQQEALRLIEALIEAVATDPEARTNPAKAIDIVTLAFLDVFKIGYRCAIGDVIYRDVNPETCRVTPPVAAPVEKTADLIRGKRPSYTRRSKR